jgi:mRNA interferase HigB
MDVRGLAILEDFWARHRDAELPLRRWLAIVTAAHWANFADCRRTFASADAVRTRQGVILVFNIKGNRYRLAAAASYPAGLVVVRRVMTHEEYGTDRWKEQL